MALLIYILPKQDTLMKSSKFFFWPHVVPKWNPNIAWGSLSWFRSIRVRGLAVMGVWKCVNNSIYESPVTTQAKTKIDHKLEPMVRLQMTIRIIRRLTSLWLLTKIFWPKFSDQNFLTEMCIENSLLSALYIFTFIETMKYISFHLKLPTHSTWGWYENNNRNLLRSFYGYTLVALNR